MIYVIFITLNIILGFFSSSLYACCVPTNTTKQNLILSCSDKDNIIRKVNTYCKFNSFLLNELGINKFDDELNQLIQIINQPNKTIGDYRTQIETILELNNITTKKNTLSIEEDKTITRLAAVIYLFNKTPENLKRSKMLGRKAALATHPDKINCPEGSKLSSTINNFLTNDKCDNYLTSLLDNNKSTVDKANEFLIEKRAFNIKIGKHTQDASFYVGYLIGQKLCSPLISDKKTKARLEIKLINDIKNSIMQANLLNSYRLH